MKNDLKQKQTIFITGAAGYVGTMLVRKFATSHKVIALDKEPIPTDWAVLMEGIPKENIVYIQANTSDSVDSLENSSGWQKEVASYSPEIVIHTAWQIREMYGQKSLQDKWNIQGSKAVFDFAFSTPSVSRLIHFSTVASYGAYPENTVDYLFTENDPFRVTDYLYAEEKRLVEVELRNAWQKFKEGSVVNSAMSSNKSHLTSNGDKKRHMQVVVVRPAAITGPRGRYGRIRFGLQSALSGQLKKNFIERLVTLLVSFTPVTEKWCRQFIHEDDVVGIIDTLVSAHKLNADYDVFNICPPGPVVLGRDMAEAVHKRPIKIHPLFIRFVFFILWHISRGKVPTSRGGWKSYSYPIAVDGSKITKTYGYVYKYEPKEAFVKKEGEYMKFLD